LVPLLLIVFGTLISMLLPLGVGGLAVVGGLAGVGLLARFTDVSTYSTNIVTLIGLGVAIDYSLFIVSRFREELAAGRVVERPLLVLLPIVALLLLMASPFLQIKIANGDVGMLPPAAETRRGYDQLQAFPGQGQTRFNVVVSYGRGRALTTERVGDLYDFAQRI